MPENLPNGETKKLLRQVLEEKERESRFRAYFWRTLGAVVSVGGLAVLFIALGGWANALQKAAADNTGALRGVQESIEELTGALENQSTRVDQLEDHVASWDTAVGGIQEWQESHVEAPHEGVLEAIENVGRKVDRALRVP